MSPAVRGPRVAPGAAPAVLRVACHSRAGSSGGGSGVATSFSASHPEQECSSLVRGAGRSTRRRWRGCVLAGLLGSALLPAAPADDPYARSRMEQARSSPVTVLAGGADDSAPVVATRIGRLFSSSEQRIELDRLRNDSDSGKDADAVAGQTGHESRPEPGHDPSAPAVTFNGIVVRNDGHLVAWVDGVEAATGTTTPAGVRIETDHTPGGRFRVRLPDGRTSAVLKPGQAVAANGRVRDAYERRPAKVRAGIPGEHSVDSGSGEKGEDAAAPVGSPDAASPPALPANLVLELLRRMRAGPAPLGMDPSGVRAAGDRQPAAREWTGWGSGK